MGELSLRTVDSSGASASVSARSGRQAGRHIACRNYATLSVATIQHGLLRVCCDCTNQSEVQHVLVWRRLCPGCSQPRDSLQDHGAGDLAGFCRPGGLPGRWRGHRRHHHRQGRGGGQAAGGGRWRRGREAAARHWKHECCSPCSDDSRFTDMWVCRRRRVSAGARAAAPACSGWRRRTTLNPAASSPPTSDPAPHPSSVAVVLQVSGGTSRSRSPPCSWWRWSRRRARCSAAASRGTTRCLAGWQGERQRCTMGGGGGAVMFGGTPPPNMLHR